MESCKGARNKTKETNDKPKKDLSFGTKLTKQKIAMRDPK